MLYAVVGLGRFVFKPATTLADKGAEVIAIDSDRALVDEIKDLIDGIGAAQDLHRPHHR